MMSWQIAGDGKADDLPWNSFSLTWGQAILMITSTLERRWSMPTDC